MELLRHWLETDQVSEDDLEVHYTNYFNYQNEEDLLYQDQTASSIGFDGCLPIIDIKPKLVVLSHNCPMVLDLNQPNKIRAFNGYNHPSSITAAKPCPSNEYLATKCDYSIAIWSLKSRSVLSFTATECADFCWINNALLATLQISEPNNEVKFWNWTGNGKIELDGCMEISQERKILTDFACTESNKSQIIAFAYGDTSFSLVSKVDVDQHYVDVKYGHLVDVCTNQLKFLLIVTSRGHVLTFDTKDGCSLMQASNLNNNYLKILKETTRNYVFGDSRGTAYFFDRTFKLQEKIKVSTNRITSVIVYENNTDEIVFCDDKSRIFRKLRINSDPPKMVYDGSIYHDILCGDCHPHGTVFSAGKSNGKLFHFDTKSCELLEETSLGEGQITALKYSPRGTLLGLGTSNGSIFILPALEGDKNWPIRASTKGIRCLIFDKSETFLAFVDEGHVVGILQGQPWMMQSRIKVHTKLITSLTFGTENDIFTVGLDKKIAHIENHLLSMKKTVDKKADPLNMLYSKEFILVGTSARQIRFINPETLMCRRIVALDGLPKAILRLRFDYSVVVSEAGYHLIHPDWTTSIEFWGHNPQGVLKIASINGVSDYNDKKLKFVHVSSKAIQWRELEKPTDVEIERHLKETKEKSIEKWSKKLMKITKTLSQIQSCKSTKTEIHVQDLELVFNGLGFLPTPEELEEIAFEIRFKDSHITWEIHETVEIEDFCLLMENYSRWIQTQSQYHQEYSVHNTFKKLSVIFKVPLTVGQSEEEDFEEEEDLEEDVDPEFRVEKTLKAMSEIMYEVPQSLAKNGE